MLKLVRSLLMEPLELENIEITNKPYKGGA